MPDVTAISAVLGSVKVAVDIAKLIKDSGSTLEKAEIKLQIAELISALADVKIEAAGVQSELIEKDKLISELNESLRVKKSVVWEKPYYWTGIGDDRDGPFCQHCYDTDQKLIRLQGGGKQRWRCHTCSNSVTDDNYVSTGIGITKV